MTAHPRAIHCKTGILSQCLMDIATRAQIPTTANSRMLRVMIINPFKMAARMIMMAVHVTSDKIPCHPILVSQAAKLAMVATAIHPL
jgi:hypothetical protein